MRKTSCSFSFTPSVLDWLMRESKNQGVSRSVFVESILVKAKDFPSNRPDEFRGSKKSKKQAFIDSILDFFDESLAAYKVGLSPEEFAEAMADVEVQKWVSFYQDVYKGMRQVEMVQSKGSKSSCFSTMVFLNAHHRDYGKDKAAFIIRIVQPMVKRFVKVVEEKLSPSLAEEIIEEFYEIVEDCMVKVGD